MKPAEYRAKREWLRSHPQGPQAQIVRRELRAHERELEDQAISLDAWVESDQARLGLSPWYEAFFHSRPGQPLASKVRHRDRDCQHIRDIGDEDVREAIEAEMKLLEPCGTCG
jgi:hypothetical protein